MLSWIPPNKLMAAGADCFILSLGGKPSFNRGDEYLHNLLEKGEFSLTEELSPSLPLAVRFTDLIKEHLKKCSPQQSICSSAEEAQFFQKKVDSVNISGKKSKNIRDKLVLVEPEKGKDYYSHLLFACAHGSSEAICLVLSHCTNINLNTPLPCDGNQGFTPLGVASLYNNTPACESLIQAGADVDQCDSYGCCALHWAVLASHLSTVKLLLKHGAKRNQGDAKGLTPLHYGCVSGTPQVLSTLLKESPSSSSSPSPLGVTPVILACSLGHFEVIKVLVKLMGQKIVLEGENQGMSSFHYASWGGSIKCLKTLANYSSWREGLVQRDKWGRTPLIIAAAKGDSAMCQLLLKKGAKLHEVDDEGRGILHWAVLSGQVSCVQYLLQHRSGLEELCNQKTKGEGAFPLHYAAIKSEQMLASILERSPGCAYVPTSCGRRAPLTWAASCGLLPCVQLLLGSQSSNGDGGDGGGGGGGDGDGDGDGGDNKYKPLHAAANVGALSVCQALIDAGYKVDDICPEGLAPFHYASHHGHTECVKLFLSNGEMVDRLTGKQESSLHLAAVYGHSATVSELLERGANRDKTLGENGECSIHLACTYGHAAVIQVLISHGADVDLPRGSDGYTPLCIAADHGHLDCCRELVEHGADNKMRMMKSTKEGLTALDIAMTKGHSGCVSYLISCHTPSGGGVYHRAAATIQAVWRYHRYKCRLHITHHWSASIIQRCIRQWLCRIRASKARRAQIASRHRAATKIQRRWREFISLKRRYETTYSRLKARLMQEQLAATLLVAELKSQAHSISLSSAMCNRKPGQRRIVIKSNPKYLLKTSSTFKPNLCPGGVLPTSPAEPRKLTTQTLSPTAHVQLPNTKSQPSEEVDVDSSGRNFPPILHGSTHTTTPTKLKKQVKLTRRKDATVITTTTTTTTSTSTIEKLPAIPPSTSLVNKLEESIGLPQSDVTTPNRRNTPKSLPPVHKPSDEVVSILSLSQLSLIRRSSTFKNTPLGYRPYVSRRIRKKEEASPIMEDFEDIRLDYDREQESPARVNFARETESIASDGASSINQNRNPQDREEGNNLVVTECDLAQTEERDPMIPDHDSNHVAEAAGNQTSSDHHGTVESEDILIDHKAGGDASSITDGKKLDEKKVLNQIERFEHLMQVLALVREAKENGGGGGGGGGKGEGIEGLKDHIMLALDEAVRLRKETATGGEEHLGHTK